MADDPKQNRYAKNPHLWRRVYSSRRRKPQVFTYINPATSVTHSLDLNKTVRHRDFFIIKGFESTSFPSGITALFDEALIYFNWEDEKTHNFTFAFPDNPHAIVMTVHDDVSSSGGVYLQGISYNSESMTIGASAPFSGSVRYRAIWSPLVPEYPATVTSSLSPASGVLFTSAKQVDVQTALSGLGLNWNVDYLALDQQPTHFWISHWSDGNETGIPVITTDGFDENTASGSVAAPIFNPTGGSAGTFHYIAFVSGAA